MKKNRFAQNFPKCKNRPSWNKSSTTLSLHVINCSHFRWTLCRYDQHLAVGEEREENRLRFAGVISFVENYLQNISNNIWSFRDKEQNKLTYEVKWSYYVRQQPCLNFLEVWTKNARNNMQSDLSKRSEVSRRCTSQNSRQAQIDFNSF